MIAEPIESHINELRGRVIVVFLSVVAVFLIAFAFSAQIVSYIISYLTHPNITVVALTPVEAFYSQVHVALFVALFITLPVFVYQVIMFLRPALRKRERNALFLVLPSFLLTFLLGIAFNFLIMIKLFLYFLAAFAGRIGVYNIWSISSFLQLVLVSSLFFGLIFTSPLVLLILSKIGIINVNSLKRFRREIYVAVFIIAAFFTPPDPVTQIAVAVPLILLYEVSVVLIRIT